MPSSGAIFYYTTHPLLAALMAARGWACVARRWQASTDRWTYLMRRDEA